MTKDTLIRVHRDERDVGYFTPETALECLRSGILRPDDWAYCEGLLDWMYLGQLLDVPDTTTTPVAISMPPPLRSPPLLAGPPVIPIATRRAKSKSPIVTFVVAGAAICFLGLFFIGALLNQSQPSSTSGYTPTPMPHFEGDSHGKPTQEDLRKGAEWLLEQDRLRGRHSSISGDEGLLPPLTNFDVNAEPIPSIPELGMSRADVANLREWAAAGAPRYWRGKDQFPGMSREQWEQLRKLTREKLEKSSH